MKVTDSSLINSHLKAQLSLEGNVEYKCDLKPEYNAKYRGVVRGRLEKSMVKTRQLKPLSDEGYLSLFCNVLKIVVFGM